MSIEPKKLKAHIGKLKGYLDNLASTPSTNEDVGGRVTLLSKFYKLLLVAELCQRGIIIPFNDGDNDNDNSSKLLEAIQNGAGKAMLNESQVPKPLVAGSAVISSMVAEKFSDAIFSSLDTSNETVLRFGFTTEEESQAQVVLQRCQDVSDVRFQILLNLGCKSYIEDYCTPSTLFESSPAASSAASTTTATSVVATPSMECIQIVAILLLRLSMGNILRATSFSNPDQPQMWKKSLDICIKLHDKLLRIQKKKIKLMTMLESGLELESETGIELELESELKTNQNQNDDNDEDLYYEAYHVYDVIYPLTNLIRIAELKKNTKRVSELSLRLVESYISTVSMSSNGRTSNDSSSSSRGEDGLIQNQLLSDKACSIWNEITVAFVNAYIPNEYKIETISTSTTTPSTSTTTTTTTNNNNQKSKNIAQARKGLKNFDESTCTDVKLKTLYQTLCHWIEIEHENFIIESLSQSRLDAVKNRTGILSTSTSIGKGIGKGKAGRSSSNSSLATSSVSTKPKKIIDIESLRLQVSRELYTKSLPNEDEEVVSYNEEYDDAELDKAATILQNKVLSMTPVELNQSIPKDMQNAIFNLIQLQVERLVKRAQAFSLNHCSTRKVNKGKVKRSDVDNAWDAVESFVKPLMEFYKEHECQQPDTDGLNLISTSSKTSMFNAASEATLVVAWMKQENHHLLEEIQIATNCLSAYHKQILKREELEKKRKEKDSQQNIVRTTSERNTHDLEKIGVDWGIWTGRSHLHLATLTSESKDSTRNCEMISRKATSFVTLSDVSTIHAQYGMPYLMFLACWSGLHKAPWSFCNVTRAREIIRFARESLSLCEREWGRKMSSIEEIMLNLGEADAECGFLSGGFTDKAKEIYENVISDITGKDMHGLDSLLQSHCLSGLIMITLSQTDSDSQDIQSLYAKGVDDAKLSLKHLTLLQESCEMPTSFQNWRSLDAFPSSLTFHLCQLRTLVAESLIRSLKPMEAEGFLKQAVTDSSSNFDAAFVLGAFWLRMSFSSNAGKNEYTKKAQVQLLKSLKLDTTKADPFSLLGVWYEVHGDLKRALGCYSKALLIDPSHPVAGRGILRLRNPKEVTNICTEAVSVSSNTSGWAWKALGDSKALIDGLDEEAILCYQQALRHRDIESAKQHTLSVFFAFPFHADGENKECSATWSALASCYRRLGKYSASLRAYESAFVNGHSDDYICAWAQVELELGLLDDAALKFEQVLMDTETSSRFSASYGLASCMLLSANRNIEEGKYGATLNDLIKGIKSLTSFVKDDAHSNFICVLKSLGDLYSHGYRIPSPVFVGLKQDKIKGDLCFESKEDFLKQGELVYMQLLEKVEKTEMDLKDFDDRSLLTAALNDVGTNLLLQARLHCDSLMEESSSNTPIIDDKAASLLDQSKEFFIRAIESNQLDPISWCGLGCALYSRDTMLSQHAFCRALQLDKNCAEAWVNLSLIYGEENKLRASEETIDALTQVADTPLMWIARGLLLEKTAHQGENVEEKLHSASDAYRACLQTSRDPSALLGLALTCRRLGLSDESKSDDYKLTAEEVASKESHANLSMFLDSSGPNDWTAQFLHGVMEIEGGNEGTELGTDLAAKVINSLQTSTVTTGNHKHTDRERKQTIDAAQQDVMMNPDNGESWLSLAKCLILSLSEVEKPTKKSRELVVDVIGRAKQILKAAVNEPTTLYPTSVSSIAHKSMVLRSIKATQLSDVHALSSWVPDQDEIASSHDLQRALLLDPENCFARAQLNE